MFMMIENAGVAPVQSFTVLGLSTARGDYKKIGQFGSGSKHGILTCLRQGLNPQIFLGEELLNFSTIDGKMGEKEYKSLTYSFKGETRELPIALEFGALDWDGLEMGLREFVSNAIDAGEFNVTVTPTMEATPDKTRIYLPFTGDVAKFYTELRTKFLHFSPEFNHMSEVLIKKERTIAKFYRKGVFVRDNREYNSLFDYNFGDSVKIDESRNMDDWSTKYHAGVCLARASVEVIAELFRNFNQFNTKLFENYLTISSCEFSTWTEKGKKNIANWKEAWKQVFGENAIAANAETQGALIEKAIAKGHKVVCVPLNLLMILHDIGIPKVNSAFDNVDLLGREITPQSTDSEIVQNVFKTWRKLEKLGVTNGKPFPQVNTFVALAEGNGQTFGFWNRADDSVNFEQTQGNTPYCILHELGHYITGASDDTADFTDFFCKVAVLLL